MFLKISLNSQENSCARASDLKTLLKKRLWDRCFPVNFQKFWRTPFLQKSLDYCFWNLPLRIWLLFWFMSMTFKKIFEPGVSKILGAAILRCYIYVLKLFAKINGEKTLLWFFFDRIAYPQPDDLWNTNFLRIVFLWILQNF